MVDKVNDAVIPVAKNNGKAFELLTKTVFESLAQLQGLTILEITQNKKLTGLSGAEHQIDVYLKFELLGQEREIVIEAKDFKSPVDKPRLMSFVGVLNDLPRRPNGMFVTRTGFDSGNIVPIAEANNIGLYVLDEYDKPAASFTLTAIQHNAQIIQLAIEEEADPSVLNFINDIPPQRVTLYDNAGNVKMNLQQLLDQAVSIMLLKNVPIGGYFTFKANDATGTLYFHAKDPAVSRVRLYGAVFQRTKTCIGEKTTSVQMTHLLQLITNDKRFFVDESGRVHRAGDIISIPFVFESAGPNGSDMVVTVFAQLKDPKGNVVSEKLA